MIQLKRKISVFNDLIFKLLVKFCFLVCIQKALQVFL